MFLRKFFFPFLISSLALFVLAAPQAKPEAAASASVRRQILKRLQERDVRLSAFKAFCSIGVPHPKAPLVQWADGLIAYRARPEFLYLKGFKPLAPLYFVLKSSEGKFQFFLPRAHKVLSGDNTATYDDPDLDMKLNAGDLLKALAPERIPAGCETEWRSSGSNGERLILKKPGGKVWRELDFDPALRLYRFREYNEAGFASLEITRSDWRAAYGIEFPFQIKIKRFLPKPNDLILVFREIRPNEPIEERILNYLFPANAETVELER